MSFQRITPQAKPASQSAVSFQTVTPASPPAVPAQASAPSSSRQERSASMKMPIKMFALIAVGAVIAGVGTGFVMNRVVPGAESSVIVAEQDDEITESTLKAGAVFGVADAKTFRDETQGVLIKGGLEGEGSHTLLREGGLSQNVYLTSSVVDLDQFDGMAVKVWGETFKGQKAGWLMDVGRLEIETLEGEVPAWYQAEQAKKQKAAPAQAE